MAGQNIQIGKTWAAFIQWMNRLWDSEPVSLEEKELWTAGFGEKKTGVDAGKLGQMSIDDDYVYICVVEGEAGVAVWKKTIIFQT